MSQLSNALSAIPLRPLYIHRYPYLKFKITAASQLTSGLSYVCWPIMFTVKVATSFRIYDHAGDGGGVNLEVGGVKFRIFTLSYNAQFWSYDNVVNMFLVRFELEKHLRTLSEHSEHFPRFLVDLKLPHGVK